jgi:proteasome lid subunit RPN8/RPN11
MIAFSSKQIKDIKDHASEFYPKECCGILLGRREADKNIVHRVIPAQNGAEQPCEHFALSSKEILDAERLAEESELEIVGFYHSHPDCSTCPSADDCKYMMPGISYPVVSVFDSEVTAIASWEQRQNREDVVQEEILKIS